MMRAAPAGVKGCPTSSPPCRRLEQSKPPRQASMRAQIAVSASHAIVSVASLRGRIRSAIFTCIAQTDQPGGHRVAVLIARRSPGPSGRFAKKTTSKTTAKNKFCEKSGTQGLALRTDAIQERQEDAPDDNEGIANMRRSS